MMEASAERWLQLAEMVLDGEESKALWSGEMEKSCCGCEETPLGLLRMLITCRHRGGAAVKHLSRFFSPTLQSEKEFMTVVLSVRAHRTSLQHCPDRVR